MIGVSQEYIDKSTAAGRDMWCRVEAGDYFYTSNEVIRFEYNDVVHPDDLQLGTTCANRFHFEVWSPRDIPLSAVIRPYLMHRGFAERCPLGEFYISYRHRKKDMYSITCYDRMYRLDTEFNQKLLTLPCTAGELLSAVAAQEDFSVSFTPAADIISYIPAGETCRAIVGYIAGLNGGCAKFNRYGQLALVQHKFVDFTLKRDNYMELTRKLDILVVKRIEFDNGEEVVGSGDGTRMTTYRQYNPFATEAVAERVMEGYKGYMYLGIEARMQGMPFLEAGDQIVFQDDVSDGEGLAVISEYTLYFDGALTATLVSKSKSPVDEYGETDGDALQLQNMIERLKMSYHPVSGNNLITFATVDKSLVDIDFNIEQSTIVLLHAQLVVETSVDCAVTFTHHINNTATGPRPVIQMKAGKPQGVTLYNHFEGVRAGRNTYTLMASTDAGTAIVPANMLAASISGQNMVGGGSAGPPEANISEKSEAQYVSLLRPIWRTPVDWGGLFHLKTPIRVVQQVVVTTVQALKFLTAKTLEDCGADLDASGAVRAGFFETVQKIPIMELMPVRRGLYDSPRIIN